MTTEPPDIFLCHASPDKPWVEQLAARIEQEDWGGRKLRVFYDAWDIQPGQNFLSRIEEGLKQARYVGVVLSPAMNDANWQVLEWQSKVYEDPVGKKGKIIPIFHRAFDPVKNLRTEIPLPLRLLSWVDFRDPKLTEREYSKLIRRIKNEPPLRGIPNPGRPLSEAHPAVAARIVSGFPVGVELPDPVDEILISNLFPVIEYPKTIWSGLTDATRPKAVKDEVPGASPFRLVAKRLYCFEDLSRPDSKFSRVVKGDIVAVTTADWLNDRDKWNIFISMMNQAVRDYCSILGLAYDHETDRIYFLPTASTNDRKVTWNGNRLTRTVAKSNQDRNGRFYVHQGATLRFETLGDKLFLVVNPCWVFTTDGRTPIRGKSVGPLNIRWGGKERNGQILRNILFWASVLRRRQDHITLDAGDSRIRIRAIPGTTTIGVGVDGDRVTIGALLEETKDELAIAAKAAAGDDSSGGDDESDPIAKSGD